MSHFKSSIIGGLAVLFLATTAHSEPLLVDSFESADMSTTNDHGFDWGRNNRTSIVTQEAAVFNNGEIYNVPSGSPDWVPLHGDHSLRFRFAAGQNMAEQRFDLGTSYPEIWISFWLRVPTNFTHPSTSPSNQKLFRLWMDGYSQHGEGSTIGLSFRSDGAGGSNFFAKVSPGDYSVVGGDSGSTPFIKTPDDRGKWMKLVIHAKAETQPGKNDGVMEVWRQWRDETNYTKTHDLRNLPIKLASTEPGFRNGYLMGWANAPYKTDTEFFIDLFTVSETSLLENTIIQPNGMGRPMPPQNLQINIKN